MARPSGDWESVRFTQTSGGSRLAHVHFRYGGSNSATGALVFDGGAPTAADLTVMAAQYRGRLRQQRQPLSDRACG